MERKLIGLGEGGEKCPIAIVKRGGGGLGEDETSELFRDLEGRSKREI